MASFIVTVPDAVVPRIQQAFGHFDGSLPPTWILGTVADVQAFVKNDIKSRVLEYETSQTAQTKRDAVNGEVW